MIGERLRALIRLVHRLIHRSAFRHSKHWKTIAVEYAMYLQVNNLDYDPTVANAQAQVMIDDTKAKLVEQGIEYGDMGS